MKPQKIEQCPSPLGLASQTQLVSCLLLMADCLQSPAPRTGSEEKSEHSEILKRALNAAYEAENRLAEQQRRISQLEKVSVTDELTGVLNRRGFVTQMKGALAAASRYKEQGVLVYVDLDDFKPVNDTHGHAAGDEVLRRVARVLQGNVRNSDYVGRMGGDEFAVLLTRSSWADGLKRSETLEGMLNNAYVGWNGRMIPIRASFGIQAYSSRDDIDDLLIRADDDMYKTKRLRAELGAELGEKRITKKNGEKNGEQNNRAWNRTAA